MWNIGFVHMVDVSRMRPPGREPLQLQEAGRIAGGHDLDASIWKIADPATDRQLTGLAG